MDSKELTERKKVISGKLGNLMKRMALHELSSTPKIYNFNLQISSSGNLIDFDVYLGSQSIENEKFYCIRWCEDINPIHYNEIVATIDKMEALFIKYSKLNNK
jgi:hypothetical protein